MKAFLSSPRLPLLAAGLLLCALLPAAPSAWADVARDYQRDCGGCHGRKADKPAFNRAPPLTSLSRQEIIADMTRLRDGGGADAASRAKARLSDAQINAFADYIMRLSPSGGQPAAPDKPGNAGQTP
ncbi:MAG: c-type cytochrome [Gibbsiella quercinecans]|uniref:c-type cytochrome n=1 Tax=Gibbsiella quercinecans TaxID=929813 RepID=UPI003F3A28FC